MASRLVLAPGLRVLPRGRDAVQLGLGYPRKRLPATPAVRRVLAALDRGEAPPVDPAARGVLGRLRPWLVDADRLAPLGVAPAEAAVAALRDPAGFDEQLQRRTRTPVRVYDTLTPAVRSAPDPAELLRAAGFPVRQRRPTAAALVLCLGEPDRAVLDGLVNAGTTHQLVRAVEGELVVGPLVEPGRTACLRCLDAHHGVDDPAYPVLAASHHRVVRHDAVAEPLDGALVALAIGWATRDLIAHLDGEEVPSWSATVRIGADLGALSVVSWTPHPACGCAWAGTPVPGAVPSATMEA